MAHAYPDPPLTDGAVRLREWRDDDDLPLVEQASRDSYVARIEHIAVPFTVDDGRRWIEQQQELALTGRGWAFVVEELGTGEAVGGVGITHRHPPGAAEPGVWILGQRRNEGLAERAVGLLCGWALTADTGVERVQAAVEPWNVAARRVLEKIGFQREGRLRAYTSYEPERRDVYLYSLLARDLS
jgi:[ribosomal protein S5]-alanine N-acetyltransferase